MAKTSGDPKDVALAAMTHLVRLMGAELVAGRHRDDLNQLEEAVRNKVGAVTVVGCKPAVVEAGLALARTHVEQALIQIRTQTHAVRAREVAQAAQQAAPPASTASALH